MVGIEFQFGVECEYPFSGGVRAARVARLMGSGRMRRRGRGREGVGAETLCHRDDALLYIAYVMLIWAAPIPADSWHCSLWS